MPVTHEQEHKRAGKQPPNRRAGPERPPHPEGKRPPPRGPRAPWPALSVPTARAPPASLWFPVLTDTDYALPVKHKGNCFCIEAGGPQSIKPVTISGREAMVSVRRLDLN